MLEAALFGQDGVPGDVLDAPRHGVAVEVGQLDPVRGEDRQVAVGQEQQVVRVIEDSRNVAGHKVFVLAEPDHRRRPLPHGHDLVQVLGRDDGQREDAHNLTDGRAHRVLKRDGVSRCHSYG